MIFVDTNILVYAYSPSDKIKQDIALTILSCTNISISTQVINEFMGVMSRKFRVDWDELRRVLGDVQELCKVETVDMKTIIDATSISERFKFSYWDSLILSSALRLNCQFLYTENLSHGMLINNQLTIVNPFRLQIIDGDTNVPS
ncbi:PIN domain-containing protein [Candidatus Magnetobacterium casense]|uniref:PIN domain-containing protein n=1 Tax=Candidatus Magnetobacterium casense TaxID=1455061 RepID=A0ABS6RW30_9BACT|nr:PIN domain-containing protein [Candidatus Magnetobacterium casensis]MBV6340796.1 PIN domain-containing protein [Candidatus Magnetobacterium casensis]